MLYGPEGLKDLTKSAEDTVVAVDGYVKRFTTLTVAIGRQMGVLEDPQRPLFEDIKKKTLATDGLILGNVMAEIDRILKEGRNNQSGEV